MKQRLNLMEKGGGAMKAMFGLVGYLAKSSIEKNLLLLIDYRVSQINGCAYCLDMHSKDLRIAGETEQRLYLLSAWRDVNLYSDRERAALEWAESLTSFGADGVSDEIYERAKNQFSEEELVELTMAVITNNGFNRLNIAFRTEAGDYQPGQWDTASSKS